MNDKFLVTIVLGCNLPLLSPVPPLGVGVSVLSVGKLDAKVNKGCTVTAQPRHRVEASCQLPVGVQIRLMGSKKALRKRGNCSNSKPPASWRHRKPACVEATLYWIPCTWYPLGLCKGVLGAH